MDKTKWYTVNIDKLNEILRSAQNEQMDCSKWTDGEFKTNSSSAQNEQSNTREYAENPSYNSSDNNSIGVQGDFPEKLENHSVQNPFSLEEEKTEPEFFGDISVSQESEPVQQTIAQNKIKVQPKKSAQKRAISKRFDINILERQVRKACKKIEPDRTEETVQVFRMFYEEWYRTFGWRGAHPRNLSQKEVENCVFDMWTLYGEHGFICDLDVEMYSELIPLYLGTTFDEDCDYSFTHFASGDIRTIKMYEWERNA